MSNDAKATTNSEGPEPQYPIQSVDNALKLILLISERARVRLKEATEYLGVAPSTAHRLLAMLEYRGFVRHDPGTKAYVAGPALTGITFATLRRIDVRELARPALERLNIELAETVHLGQLDGSMVRFIDAIESSRVIRVASRLGLSMPAHCTATGKALLAQLPEDELRRIYPEEELERMTARSIGLRQDLERELGRVRRAGYATNREESEEGVSSAAVAVNSSQQSLRVAINVAVPTSRLSVDTMRRVTAALKEAAAEIASHI